MTNLNRWLLLSSVFLLIAACGNGDEDDPFPCWDGNNLLLNVEALAGTDGSLFALDSVFENNAGQELKISELRFYLSDVRAVRDDFSEIDITDIVLKDFADTTTFDFALPAGTYQALRLGIGVSPDLNTTDPVTYPDDHPLSYSQNTYWTWNTQYKFVMIEGRFNQSYNDEGTIEAFSYHTGTDTLYRTVDIPKLFTLYDNQRTQVDLTLDINEVFDNLDMLDENFTHTTSNFLTAYKVTQNFQGALR